jgi:hypothetical protein
MQGRVTGFIALAALASSTSFAQPPNAAATLDFGSNASRSVSPARGAAEQALRQLGDRLRGKEGTVPQGFPFDIRDVADLRGARLGYGFEVFDADAASLNGGDSLARSAQATGAWRFAVTSQGRVVGLITLVPGASGWDVVSLGGAGLSREIDAVVYAQGARNDTRLRYVRVPQATSDFIEVQTGAAEARFAPLQAARENLRLAAGKGDGLLSEREVQTSLRHALERTLTD